MPRPTSSTTLQRPDLGLIAYEYMYEASQRGFIGLQILPILEVAEQSSDYPVIPIEAILKVQDTSRAPRGAYQRGDYEFETDTYSCVEHGWEEPVDDVEAKLYARYFDAEQVATMRATDILLRDQERRIAAAVFNASNITGTAGVTTEWSTGATCTPYADVAAGKEAMRAAVGLIPNALVMSYKVFNNVIASKEIRDKFQYTSPMETRPWAAQLQAMANYFGVDRILVGGAMYDSAKQGQSFSLADIWDDEYVLIAKLSNGGRDLRDPCLGRTFLWTADSPQNIITEQYREEQTRSDIYRVRQYTDEEFVFTGAGYLLSNITA